MTHDEAAPIAHRNAKGNTTFICSRCRVSRIVENIANETPERIAEARDACTKCKGHKSDSFWTDGERWMHYDGAQGGVNFAIQNADPLADPRNRARGRLTNAPQSAEDALLELLRNFKDLKKTELLVIHALMNGNSYTGAGEYAGGISKQAAQMAAFRAMRRFPALAAIAPHTKVTVNDMDGVERSLEDRRIREVARMRAARAARADNSGG